MDRVTALSLSLLLVYFAMQWDLGNSRVMQLPSVVNCTTYNASRFCPPTDRSIFCLTNGTTVNGICDAQVAACVENATISDSMAPCQQTVVTTAAADATTTSNQGQENAATQLQGTTLCYLSALFLVTSSLCVGLFHNLEFWVP